jgi:hypothetical protein
MVGRNDKELVTVRVFAGLDGPDCIGPEKAGATPLSPVQNIDRNSVGVTGGATFANEMHDFVAGGGQGPSVDAADDARPDDENPHYEPPDECAYVTKHSTM